MLSCFPKVEQDALRAALSASRNPFGTRLDGSDYFAAGADPGALLDIHQQVWLGQDLAWRQMLPESSHHSPPAAHTRFEHVRNLCARTWAYFDCKNWGCGVVLQCTKYIRIQCNDPSSLPVHKVYADLHRRGCATRSNTTHTENDIWGLMSGKWPKPHAGPCLTPHTIMCMISSIGCDRSRNCALGWLLKILVDCGQRV